MFSWMKSACPRHVACRSVVKESLPFGGSGAKVSVASAGSAFSTAPRIQLLHFRLDVGGDDIDAEVQRTCRPTAANDPGPQQARES